MYNMGVFAGIKPPIRASYNDNLKYIVPAYGGGTYNSLQNDVKVFPYNNYANINQAYGAGALSCNTRYVTSQCGPSRVRSQ